MKTSRPFDSKSALIGFMAAIILVLAMGAAGPGREQHGHISARSLTIVNDGGVELVRIGAGEFDSGPHGYVSVYHYTGDKRGSAEIRVGDLTLQRIEKRGRPLSVRRQLEEKR